MNILQGLTSNTTFCVTLNATDQIDKSRIIDSFEYSHPVFNKGSLNAAEQIIEPETGARKRGMQGLI